MPKIGIIIPDSVGIGDAIQFGCVPENYFRNKGVRLIDSRKHYVFDHNPYVVRDEKPDIEIDLWSGPSQWASPCPSSNSGGGFNRWVAHPTMRVGGKDSWASGWEFLSKSERWCAGLGLEKCYLRHPRLYIHEDTPKFAREPVVSFHCVGKTRGSLSDEVIGVIKKNYEGFKIIQVGGPHDKPTPFIDRRGLSFWESVKIVAESQLFIGITSGMYYASRCYSNVRKKIIVQDDHMNEERLKGFAPYGKGYGDWIDFDVEIFNTHDYDIGITRALRKV